MSNLSTQQQQNVESYIDFLLFQNSRGKQGTRKPLDFSKYNTVTHVWVEDAQSVVDKLR